MRAAFNFMINCLALVVVGEAALAHGAEGGTPQPGETNGVVAIAIDVSTSMQKDGSLDEAKASATLACSLLRGRVVFVKFSDQVTLSQTFDLASQRGEAVAWIANLSVEGGTKYLPAIEAVARLDPKVAIFLSDGAPEENPDAILALVRNRIACPVHTIAVQGGDKAREVLGQMAGATRGGFHVVGQSGEIVGAFLAILGQIRQFSRCELTAPSLKMPDVEGELLAIGLESRPEIAGATDHQQITVGGRSIHIVRLPDSSRRAVTVSVPEVGRGKRAIVVRFDLPSAELRVGPVVLQGDRARVEVAGTLRDPAGHPIDPRNQTRLTTRFEALDQQGQVIQSIPGRISQTGPEVVGQIDLPAPGGAPVSFTARMTTEDTTAGVPFQVSESRVVVVDPATAQRAPSSRAASTIGARGGTAGRRVTATATITVDGGTDDERRAFLKELEAHPPTIEVRNIQSGASLAVDRATRYEEDRAVVQELSWMSDDKPGRYEVILPAGTAAGITYPAARGEATTVAVAGDALQMIVMVYRANGPPLALLDTFRQPGALRRGMAGDEVSIQLVRNKDRVTLPEFSSLHGGLRARLVREDGSVEDVPLSLDGDRFVTERRRFLGPGRLVVRVDVGGLGLQIEGEVTFDPVELGLEVTQVPVWESLSALPQGLIAPMAVAIRGSLGGRPAGEEELAEIIERDGLRVVWSLRDGSGERLSGAAGTAGTTPIAIEPWLERSGPQSMRIELVDRRERVVQAIGWQFTVMDSPLRIGIARNGARGELVPVADSQGSWHWLPEFLCQPIGTVVTVRPSNSAIFTAYHLADCRVGDVEAAYVASRGQFEAEFNPGSSVTCKGTLRPYAALATDAPGPELRVIELVKVQQGQTPHPGRVAAFLAIALASIPAGYRLMRRCALHRLEAPGLRARLLGASGRVKLLVGTSRRGWRWPCAEILVGRTGPADAPWTIDLFDRDSPEAEQVRSGVGAILAIVRLEPGGSVTVQARQDLPGLKAKHARRLVPGERGLTVGPNVVLVVESSRPTPQGSDPFARDQGRANGSAAKALPSGVNRITPSEPPQEFPR